MQNRGRPVGEFIYISINRENRDIFDILANSLRLWYVLYSLRLYYILNIFHSRKPKCIIWNLYINWNLYTSFKYTLHLSILLFIYETLIHFHLLEENLYVFESKIRANNVDMQNVKLKVYTHIIQLR